MESIKNPFEVLGFNPEIIRGLSTEDVLKLIKPQYRVLQSIYHPDKTKTRDDKKSKEINGAYELLQNPEMFKYFKEKFLKRSPLRKRISDLEKEIISTGETTDCFYKQIISYLGNYAGSDKVTVFNIAPCRLKMLDYVLMLNRNIHLNMGKGKKDLFYDLIIRKNGGLARKRGKEVTEYPDKRLVGTISEEIVRSKRFGNIRKILNLAQQIWTYEDARVGRTAFPMRKVKESAIYDGHITTVSFQSIMPLITPEIKNSQYLFSINREKGKTYFAFEGKILKIRKSR